MFEASPDLPQLTDADAADANGEGAGQGTVQGEDEEIPTNEDGGTETATADNSTDVAEKFPVETGVVAVGVAPLDGTGEVKENEKEGEEAMEVDDQGPPDDNDAPDEAPDQAMNITDAEVKGSEGDTEPSLGLQGTKSEVIIDGEVEGQDEGETEGELEGEIMGTEKEEGEAKGCGDAGAVVRGNEGDTEPSPGLQGTKSEVIIDGEAEGQDEGETEGELVGETKGATKGTEKDEGESKGCGDDCNEGSIEDRPDSEPVAIAASQAQVVSRRRSTRIKNLSVPDRHVSASSIAPPHTRKNLAQKRKRDMADGEQEPVTEDPPAKKSKTEVDLDFSPGWTRGRFVYKKGRDTRVSWVSPARKIEFKYRKEAILFDSLRTQCEGDEVKAWIEYTKIKDAEKKTREVVDPRGVDEELGLDITMIRSKNTAETKIGAGWEVSRVECGKVRNRWISPVRKMSFRYLMDAILFESLRKQYGEDEIQAWVEYTKIRYLERKNREVENAEQFDDDNIGDVWVLRKNADNDTPGPGWVYSTVPRNGMRSSKTGIWISPIRKMRFRNRKDAVLFESLRMKYGTDEIKAWVEYSKIKHSKNERREVLECHIYDTVDGSATGRWTKAEHKLFLKGLSMFGQNGRNYRKISELIGSRSYDQVKSYGKRFFYNGGKAPAEGCDSSSSDEDSIEEEEEQKELQLKPQAKPTRRRSTSTIKNTSISMNDGTAKTPSLKQTRRSLPMRSQPSRVQPNRSGKVQQSYEEDTLTSFDGESCRLNKRKQQKTSASPQSKASLPKDTESSSINEEADISKEEKDTKQKKKVTPPATTLHSSRRVQQKRGSPAEPVNEGEDPSSISVDNESKQGRRRTLPLRVQKRKVSTAAHEGRFSEPEKVNSSPDHKAATKPMKPKTTRRISVRHLAKEPPATFETLSTDDLYRIASFSSTVKDLTSFCLISKLTNAALAKGTPDEIYRTLFLKEFGEDMCVGGDILVNWTWKERWTKLWFLRRGFRSESSAIIMPSSVGVLRWEKEEAALFEDNPLIAPVDRDVSKGYFGLQALHNMPKPPKANDSPSWGPNSTIARLFARESVSKQELDISHSPRWIRSRPLDQPHQAAPPAATQPETIRRQPPPP